MTVAVGSLQLGWSALAKWIGVGFIVGITGAGAAAYTTRASPPPGPGSAAPISVALSPSAPSPAVTPPHLDVVAVPAAPSPGVVAPNPFEGDARRDTKRAPARVAATAAVASAAPTFDAELRLITAAKRELDAGRAHLARVWLDEHRRRFPAGVFRVEREGLLVLVGCSATQNAGMVHNFAARHPDSPMLAQLRRRCGGEVADGKQ